MPDLLLTPDRIRAYLIEVAELLSDGSPQTIVVVGGSLLALLGFREATNDVDSIKRLGTSLKDAVAQVAWIGEPRPSDSVTWVRSCSHERKASEWLFAKKSV